jgi:hypothetical protein
VAEREGDMLESIVRFDVSCRLQPEVRRVQTESSMFNGIYFPCLSTKAFEFLAYEKAVTGSKMAACLS